MSHPPKDAFYQAVQEAHDPQVSVNIWLTPCTNGHKDGFSATAINAMKNG